MDTTVVGMREFRARLAEFLLHSDKPVAVTRHGATVGYFIPARGAQEDLNRAALKEAAVRMDEMLKHADFDEQDLDQIAKEFKSWRKRRKEQALAAVLILDANILLRAVLGRRVNIRSTGS